MTYMPELDCTHEVYTTLAIGSGQVPEPAVSSREFLTNFLCMGVWLRALALESHAKVLTDQKATDLQKLAASAAAYQQIGLAVEDTLVTLVAWSTWTRLPDLNLADIYSRIVLRSSRAGQSLPYDELENFWRRIAIGRGVINGRVYLKTMMDHIKDKDLPAICGVPWKRNPSVHLVQGAVDKIAWERLPQVMRELVNLLTDPTGEVTTVCLNKIKHGPQVTLETPIAVAKRRGFEQVKLQAAELPTRRLIRVLTQGARTQETEAESMADVHIAPFILDDPHNIYGWLNGPIMDYANFLFTFGRWLHKVRFPEHSLPNLPDDAALWLRLSENRADVMQRGNELDT